MVQKMCLKIMERKIPAGLLTGQNKFAELKDYAYFCTLTKCRILQKF